MIIIALGLVIPILTLFIIFMYSVHKCTKGKGNEIVPRWVSIVLILSIFILGLTLGTLL